MCKSSQYRWGFAWFALLAGLLVAGILPAHAQDSPHGPLTIGCEDCHKSTSWNDAGTGAQFNHARTKFPLKGQHTTVTCRQCHSTLRFADASTNCRSCHADIHLGELGSLCERCHSPGSWLVPDMAQRHSRTRFVLAGPHLALPCESCHRNQQTHKYLGLPVSCYGCHKPDYDASTNPPHRATGISTDCLQCHTASALVWRYGFDHNRTSFKLTGAHPTVACSKCHSNKAIAATPSECVQCHQLQYTSTRNPVHSSPVFPLQCQVCHTTSAWTPATFDHTKSIFQLTGAHAAVPCAQCHVNNRYTGTATACYGCHQPDFQKTTNPAHVAGRFSTDCKTCHTTIAWAPATFDHAKSIFPLTGAHAATPCAQCHANNRYTGTPALCNDCHQGDFQKTTNPAHVAGGFSTDCKTCHTTIAWAPATFDHAKSVFPLTGAHVTIPCVQCHVNNRYTGTATACYGCHQPDFQKTTNPAHVAGGFSTDCKTCHTTIAWAPATFDHAKSIFPLTGAHAATPCAQCHVNNRYTGTPALCNDCHQGDFQKTTNPAHVAGGFSTDCKTCHTTIAWAPATFDHAKSIFPLTGAHVTIPCVQCHVNNRYTGTPALCNDCHQGDFQKTTNPAHVAGGFSTDCKTCHTTIAWAPATFDHAKSVFPLTGAHVTIPCVQCHVNNRYTGTPALCNDCHQGDFQKTTNPAHVAGGFSTDCKTCHTTIAWTPATFDHAKSVFPLTGAHVTIPCVQCHVNNRYTGTPALCNDCHQGDFQKTTNPAHVAGGFSTDCKTCHTTIAWAPATFDHAKSVFPLTGAHVTIPCVQCHVNNRYTGTPALCNDCHQGDFQKTTNPAHVAGGFSTDCKTCHTTIAWAPATFDHAKSVFPLTGAHVTIPCVQCHVNNRYTGTPALCNDCHQGDFQKTTNPAHVAGGFSTDCKTCHTTIAWAPATFDHAKSVFPLTGAHVTVPCVQCHVNNRYTGTPTLCNDCHQGDFQKTTNPAHVAGGFSTDCKTCHTTMAWAPATFDHAKSIFPLTGAHVATPCIQCHVNNRYTGTPTLCNDCHQGDFQKTTNPAHVAGGFSTDCKTCHTTMAWAPATFDHAKSVFPLTGAHVTVPCVQCHVNNRYTGTSTICYDCHTADFQKTANPGHVAAGFPTDCKPCHTTVAWQPSTYNHDPLFPISAGSRHSPGRWTTCGDCHTVPTNYKVFACVNCHAHLQPTMDSKHSGVRNYKYDSASCYSCHPRGNAG